LHSLRDVKTKTKKKTPKDREKEGDQGKCYHEQRAHERWEKGWAVLRHPTLRRRTHHWTRKSKTPQRVEFVFKENPSGGGRKEGRMAWEGRRGEGSREKNRTPC